MDVSGAYYCKSEDGKLSLILKPAGMAGKNEVKEALCEEGLGCGAFTQSVGDVKKKDIASPSISPIQNKPEQPTNTQYIELDGKGLILVSGWLAFGFAVGFFFLAWMLWR